MKRAHVLIYGKVQGVWFRAHTKKEANRIDICGWVRNIKDGSVEAIFEGNDDQIGEIINWCHKGPDMSRVDKVKVSYEKPEGEIGFEIRY